MGGQGNTRPGAVPRGSGPLVWIDLDNAPHVVTFAPIAKELAARGHRLWITARRVNRTPELAIAYGIQPDIGGSGFGKAKLAKVTGTILQGFRLAMRARRRGIILAVSHGSRSQAIAAALLRLRSVVLFDYENADLRIFRAIGSRHYYPAILDEVVKERFRLPPERRFPYPGLKEHLALLTAESDIASLKAAGIPVGSPYAVIRPESDTAHYLETQDDSLLLAAVDKCRTWNLRCVIVPRTDNQERRLKHLLRGREIIFPSRPVNGMRLLKHAALLISGGGTMNREAAVLGTPCISIFRGKLGFIDRQLIRQGRLLHVSREAELIAMTSPPTRWAEDENPLVAAKAVLNSIADELEQDIQKARQVRPRQ